MQASELATELFDEVQSPRCTFAISIATAKLPATHHGHVRGITQYKMASNIQLTTGRFVTLTTFSSNLGAIVELGQHQRGDLTVFRHVEFTTR